MDIQGRTALVTGGARRVGKAITLALAEAGANVVINYANSAADAEQTAREAEALGVEALTFQADVTKYEDVGRMVDAAVERFGTIDVLVNNASSFESDPIPTDDLTVWHKSIDTLVHGPFYCSNLVAPVMLRNDGGVIVSIGDLSAFEPWPGYAGHAVGKGAILSLSRQLALELAPTVRSNVVVPGPAMRPEKYDDETYQRVSDDTLLERWGTPQEMAAAVLFFVQSDYITGETITVDGGQRFGHRKHGHG